MRKPYLNRRDLLRRSITTTASLPFLSYLPSLGAAETPRKRLILMFSPNGTIPDEFFPSGGEYNFTLKRILQPLSALRDELIIYKGIENKTPRPGSAHQRGMGGLWTASQLNEGDSKGGGDAAPVSWASGISIDQFIANRVGRETRFKSLEYAIQASRPSVWTRMSYADNNTPIEPEQNPYDAFDRLYENFDPQPGDLNQQESRNLRLASVLDGVLDDFNRLRPHLSAEDRIKLDQHSESVRDIESSLQIPDVSNVCYVPDLGERIDAGSKNNFEAIGKLFMDLTVSAFACDQTAIAGIQYTRATSQQVYPHLNINDPHHTMSHESDDNNSVREKLIKINTWYAQQFAYLVEKLQNTPDPSGQGSLLDNTYVLWGNELGKGNNHTRRNIPFISAGSCGGYFNTGRYVQFENNPSHSRLLTTIAHAFGINASGFGDFDQGGLPNLKA